LEDKIHELLNDGTYPRNLTPLGGLIAKDFANTLRKDRTLAKRLAVEVVNLIQRTLGTFKGQLIRWYSEGCLVKDSGKDRVVVELKKLLGSNIAVNVEGSITVSET